MYNNNNGSRRVQKIYYYLTKANLLIEIDSYWPEQENGEHLLERRKY